MALRTVDREATVRRSLSSEPICVGRWEQVSQSKESETKRGRTPGHRFENSGALRCRRTIGAGRMMVALGNAARTACSPAALVRSCLLGAFGPAPADRRDARCSRPGTAIVSSRGRGGVHEAEGRQK